MISTLVYIVNWALLAIWHLPSFLRKPKQIAWVDAFTKPLQELHATKQAWRADIRYKLQHNGQVIYLEKVLNEFLQIPGYDHQDHLNTKQIYIGEGEQQLRKFIYTTTENEPLHIYTSGENNPVFIYTRNEYDSNYSDFIIWIPSSVNYVEAEIRAVVDYYINTRFYKIKTY